MGKVYERIRRVVQVADAIPPLEPPSVECCPKHDDDSRLESGVDLRLGGQGKGGVGPLEVKDRVGELRRAPPRRTSAVDVDFDVDHLARWYRHRQALGASVPRWPRLEGIRSSGRGW